MATKKTKSRTPVRRRAPSAPRVAPKVDAALPESDPGEKPFTPEVLDRTTIAIPLLEKLKQDAERRKAAPDTPAERFDVIIDLHLEYPGGRESAKQRVQDLVESIIGKPARGAKPLQGINQPKTDLSEQYVFGRFEARVIEELVRRDGAKNAHRSIYRIWPDFSVRALVNKSISTVKADAALKSFASYGERIVWAVMDSGIDGSHPHFRLHANLDLDAVKPLKHRDFTALDGDESGATTDLFGHGTHVAGIIAGEVVAEGKKQSINAVTRYRDEKGEVKNQDVALEHISGMAPRCTLLSLKVLDDEGRGQASSLIAAIEEIQRINGYGRYLRVHGVNMSVGYDFEPEWFACGQSPLCVEVDRLVKSGVVVVVAAGNTGYGFNYARTPGRTVSAGLGLTINDPGNAELAITVGSTHREMPHVYGVSYYSSKGPTGDGRLKPDIVAPGEKIISCASASTSPGGADGSDGVARYREDSGTSMAAPHVSGVIAAFLSVRREFIGKAEKVKDIFVSTATDLKRDRYFQGGGLVDLMRAIQSV